MKLIRFRIGPILALFTLQPAYAVTREEVTVCLHPDVVVQGQTLAVAEKLAETMLAEASVRIDWCSGRAVREGISIEFSERTPEDFHPGAVAFARPYGSGQITVFYDRILKRYPANLVTAVLGHVLVHEMTHVLQGIDRHSECGVMRAHWTSADLNQMATKPLSFTAEDIELIQRGIEARTWVRADSRPEYRTMAMRTTPNDSAGR